MERRCRTRLFQYLHRIFRRGGARSQIRKQQCYPHISGNRTRHQEYQFLVKGRFGSSCCKTRPSRPLFRKGQLALNVYNSRGKTLDATIPTGIHQLRFVYTSTKGAIAFDDLTITTSGYVYLPLAESADAGTALNYTVEIPSSATGIRFSVVGLDSEGRRSRPSNQVFVRLETNGINDAIASTKTISANGRTVLYSGTPGDIVTVYTLSGAVAAKTQAGTDGHAEMELPAGFYIVTTPQGSIKINLK